MKWVEMVRKKSQNLRKEENAKMLYLKVMENSLRSGRSQGNIGEILTNYPSVRHGRQGIHRPCVRHCEVSLFFQFRERFPIVVLSLLS